MELSDEEIKAIKKIKKMLYMFPESEELKLLLNLIDKQQKEIDRFNRKQADDEMLKDTFIERDYISKDKIKELKEKVEKEMISNPYDFSYMINELLKEE